MYYSVTDVLFWLFGIVSFLALIISCYLPGWLLVKKLQLNSQLTETIISVVVGFVLWAFQGVIFGYLNIRFATYAYILFALFFVWRDREKLWLALKNTIQEVKKTNRVIIIALIVSIVFQLYAHLGSGVRNAEGVVFYFVNSVDGVMHLSYIQSIAQHFPPVEPGFAGKSLENYHYWGDLVLAEFHRIWHIPIIHLFFHYFPKFLIVLTMLLVIQIVKALKGSTLAILMALFLYTFGADAAFIFSQYLNGNWGAEIASLDTGVSFIFNMPQVFSRVVLLAAIMLLIDWTKTKKFLTLFVIAILGSALFGFKVYYGLYFILGFGCLSLHLLVRDFININQDKKNLMITLKSILEKNKFLLIGWVIIAVLSSVIFVPTNSNSGGLFLEPLAWTKKLLSADNFNYQDWFLRMQVYEETNNIKSIFAYNLLGVVITLLSIYGGRFIGILPFRKTSDSLSPELLSFIIPANIIFIIIGLLFLQTTGGFNIYNFLITPLVTMNIVAALSISKIKNKVLYIVCIVLIIFLSLPRTIIQLNEYTTSYKQQQPDTVITSQELELLNHLRSLPAGVVQADLKNSYENSTPYLSFFTNKATYLGGKYLLKMDYQLIEQREKKLTDLFNSQSAEEMSMHMKELGIRYLYITDQQVIEKVHNWLVNSNSLIIEKQNQAGVIILVY